MAALREFVESKSLNVDRQAGVIRDVKILGHESANGRSYSRGAISKARGLYEGMRVNVDHPKKPGESRGVSDRFGKLVNVREKSDGLYGDLQYIKAHPLAEMTVEVAERMPDQLGLSHNAEGRMAKRGGKQLVEEITKVHSVDLVSDPATVKGLFESEGSMDPETMGAETPAETAGSGNAIKDAFNAEIMKIVNGDGDLQTKVSGIKDLLKSLEQTMDKLSGKPKEPAPDDAGESAPAEESRRHKATPTVAQLQEQLNQFQVREEVRELFEAVGVRPNSLQVKAACLLPTEAERKAFVESMKGGGARPRSAGPLTESRREDGESFAMPKDSEAFAALAR